MEAEGRIAPGGSCKGDGIWADEKREEKQKK